jgi:hypothetical protein
LRKPGSTAQSPHPRCGIFSRLGIIGSGLALNLGFGRASTRAQSLRGSTLLPGTCGSPLADRAIRVKSCFSFRHAAPFPSICLAARSSRLSQLLNARVIFCTFQLVSP